jgi:hypothetical protein
MDTEKVGDGGDTNPRTRIMRRAAREGLAVQTEPVFLPGYMRKADAAKYLNISIRTLTDWMQKKLVAYAKLSHRVCLFKQADLDAAMSRYRVKAVGE